MIEYDASICLSLDFIDLSFFNLFLLDGGLNCAFPDCSLKPLLREWTADRCTVKFLSVSVSAVYGMAWEGVKVFKRVISYNG
jgi:hypothetical protein